MGRNNRFLWGKGVSRLQMCAAEGFTIFYVNFLYLVHMRSIPTLVLGQHELATHMPQMSHFAANCVF